MGGLATSGVPQWLGGDSDSVRPCGALPEGLAMQVRSSRVGVRVAAPCSQPTSEELESLLQLLGERDFILKSGDGATPMSNAKGKRKMKNRTHLLISAKVNYVFFSKK